MPNAVGRTGALAIGRSGEKRGVRGLVVRAAGLVVLCLVFGLAGCGPAVRAGVPTTLPNNRGSSALLPGASIAPTLAGVVEPPSSGAYIGVYQPPAPFDMSALDAYSTVSDKPPAILMWYQPWTTKGPREFDPAAVVALYQRNTIPMVTWEPWDPGQDANRLQDPSNQPGYRLVNIIDGKFDPYIRKFAKAVKSVRGPVMIRMMHEMNGDWYPWSGTANGNKPGEFIAAWRHVHDLFAEEGATNVTWVWSINHESVPATVANEFAAYYPGTDYVDWVSISGFNWGTSNPTTSWHSLDYWYQRPMAFLAATGKPVVVSEFASVENGGNKAEWIGDAYRQFEMRYDVVRAVVYYNKREWQHGTIQDWRITTSPESLRAYRAAVGSTYYVGAPATTLSEWTDTLTTANWVYLRTLRPVY
jgi:mannan endo-1,4-beta-mannosidase